MFVDEVKISITAGKGGNGCVHFRREKYIPKGGPDGGNGGKGGNIIFESVNNVHTLYDFRHKKKFVAQAGRPGDQNHRTGRNGEDLLIKVPVGTIIKRRTKNDEIAETMFDFTEEKQTFTAALGGIGGKGNSGFKNSIRQAPNFAEKGDIGQHFDLHLELKLVADVALVGYPSVGKSTFISVVSNARPKIAEYHFTTLVPNLGVAKVEDQEIVFVDVPGLIEGASEGKGLGHTFLKHIERASFVLHLVDINSDTPLEDFRVIRKELEKFSPKLAQKPFLPVFNKIDVSDEEFEDFMIKEFEQEFKVKPFKVSAVTHEGMDGLLKYLLSQLPKEREYSIESDSEQEVETHFSGHLEEEKVVEFRPGQKVDGKKVKIEKTENWWNLENERLLQMGRQTDWTHEGAQERLYDVLKKWGTLRKLEKLGAIPGDNLRIGEEFLVYRG